MLISRTPPSKPLSRVKLFLNVTLLGLTIAITGESNRLSLTTDGSSTNASLGAESGVVAEVTQSGAGPVAFAATHPPGNAGATTLSNDSFKSVLFGAVTLIDAEALPDPPLVLVNDAVLFRFAPQVLTVVVLITCACDIELPPSVPAV